MKYKILHRLYASIALVILFFLLYWSARFMWADIQAIPARNAIIKWEKALNIDDNEWQMVSVRLHAAFELNSLSADYAMDLGRLYEWQALQKRRWTKHAHHHRELAIQYFRTATQLRPSWGFAWAHLAQSKIINQELDKETIAALEKAMVLAPWEIGVQKKVISVGFVIWNNLSKELQEQISRELERAIQLQPRAMIELATKQGWVKHIEPLLSDERDLQYLAQLQKTQHK